MDTYRAIVSRRDTRAYAAIPIPDDVLHRILQAGRMAGSAKDAQPVRLVVLRDAKRKQELAACGNFTEHVPACAAAVAVVLQPEGPEPDSPFAIFRGPFDAGRAAQNIMLAAWAEGIASCPASMHDAGRARDVLGLPEGYVVANVIVLGYPAEAGGGGRGNRRVSLDEYARWERW